MAPEVGRAAAADGGLVRQLSWQDVTLRLVDALAWPVVALAGMVILRRQLAGLIDRVRKVEWGSFRAELDRLDRGIRQATAPRPPYPAPPVPTPFLHYLFQLARDKPGDTIRAVVNNVERAVVELAVARGISADQPVDALIAEAEKREIVSSDIILRVQKLRELRDLIADIPDPLIGSERAQRVAMAGAELAAAVTGGDPSGAFTIYR